MAPRWLEDAIAVEDESVKRANAKTRAALAASALSSESRAVCAALLRRIPTARAWVPLGAVLLLLAACADDRYTVQPGGPASAATETAMAADLHACKMASVHRYYQDGGGTGAAIGAAVLGVPGVLIGTALQGETGGLVPSDMNRMTEACMRARGYEGTSR